MDAPNVNVAVLMATHNGERYVEQQIRSLANNNAPFVLHWIDDLSTDRTREVVRAVSQSEGISLQEWHHSCHQGVPAAFFHLLDCVEADVYMFCDQDDIWQPAKIDATVQNLYQDLALPVICFTDPLAFKDDRPDQQHRMLELMGSNVNVALQESRAFMCLVAYGHTEGFTRALRDLYMKHGEIAKSYALMHDIWMYNLALAAGIARLLPDAPTTLYRWHGNNISGGYSGWQGKGAGRIVFSWRQHQLLRSGVSRHAVGFIRAAPTLPQSPKLDRLTTIARLLAGLHRRQSPAALMRLIRHGAMWPSWRLATELAFACLVSDATI